MNQKEMQELHLFLKLDLLQKSIKSCAQGGLLAAGDGDESTYATASLFETINF
jgi:hypothetical protein